jgi:outer membrane receptor for monomeric catechols
VALSIRSCRRRGEDLTLAVPVGAFIDARSGCADTLGPRVADKRRRVNLGVQMIPLTATSISVCMITFIAGALATPYNAGRKVVGQPQCQASERGYSATCATGPTGEKKPIMEVPGSVTVLPHRALNDLSPTSISRALRSAAGINGSGR